MSDNGKDFGRYYWVNTASWASTWKVTEYKSGITSNDQYDVGMSSGMNLVAVEGETELTPEVPGATTGTLIIHYAIQGDPFSVTKAGNKTFSAKFSPSAGGNTSKSFNTTTRELEITNVKPGKYTIADNSSQLS